MHSQRNERVYNIESNYNNNRSREDAGYEEIASVNASLSDWDGRSVNGNINNNIVNASFKQEEIDEFEDASFPSRKRMFRPTQFSLDESKSHFFVNIEDDENELNEIEENQNNEEEEEEEDTFGWELFTEEETKRIREKLEEKLTVNDVIVRGGFQGRKFVYITNDAVVSHANELFGKDGWRFQVIKHSEIITSLPNGKSKISIRIFGQIMLKNGQFKKEFGFGNHIGTLEDGWHLCYRSASSDCMKRCLRLFGSYLGNCLYSKEFADGLKEERLQLDRTSTTKTVKKA